jgi:hypothetical protein
MQRFPDNPSAADRFTYRRSMAGLYLFYSVAIIASIGVTFAHRLMHYLHDSSEHQIVRLTATPPTGVAPATSLVAKR